MSKISNTKNLCQNIHYKNMAYSTNYWSDSQLNYNYSDNGRFIQCTTFSPSVICRLPFGHLFLSQPKIYKTAVPPRKLFSSGKVICGKGYHHCIKGADHDDCCWQLSRRRNVSRRKFSFLRQSLSINSTSERRHGPRPGARNMSVRRDALSSNL